MDLTAGELSEERWDASVLRKWVGGNGVGARVLYDELTGWDWATGRPPSETLGSLGLEAEARDLWG